VTTSEVQMFKVLGPGGFPYHGGNGLWSLPHDKEPGEWMPEIKHIALCERGYHLVRPEHLVCWLGPVIYRAEGRGEHIAGNDKDVFGQARLLGVLETWNERTARLFAADCAERVLPIWEKKYPTDERVRKMIEITRAFARGQATKDNLVAAWDAAWDAAGDAERSWQTERLFAYLKGGGE